MTTPLKCAFVGLGMGRNHGKLMQETGRMEVVAFCDPDDRRLADIQPLFPNAKYYKSQAEMLAAEKLDIIAQAVPHFLHTPLAIEALEAGVNVVVEKPMATSYADCQKMIHAARKAGKTLTVYHNRRLDPWFLTAMQLIQEGKLGKVFEINVAIGYGHTSDTWRGDKAASGGVMFDWGAHLVDYAMHFAQSKPVKISGWFYRRPEVSPTRNHDHGELRIYFESGAIANVAVSAKDFSTVDRYRILGTEATYSDPWNWKPEMEGMLHTPNPENRFAHLKTPVPYVKPPGEFYQMLAAHFLDQAPLAVTPESAAEVIKLLELAEQSADAGGIPIAVPQG
ncbi:MAG: Gfo/Idh/MocA family oxidoreductase [Verrucomicrobiota bacterium]|nr:Gfo/Idh/MocA family oxidoreductase [Verrucomicrobiota bacterium]